MTLISNTRALLKHAYVSIFGWSNCGWIISSSDIQKEKKLFGSNNYFIEHLSLRNKKIVLSVIISAERCVSFFCVADLSSVAPWMAVSHTEKKLCTEWCCVLCWYFFRSVLSHPHIFSREDSHQIDNKSFQMFIVLLSFFFVVGRTCDRDHDGVSANGMLLFLMLSLSLLDDCLA